MERVIPPKGMIFEVVIDFRGGELHLAHMSVQDCPLAKHHQKHRRPDAPEIRCSICNGKDQFMRFEDMRKIKALPGLDG